MTNVEHNNEVRPTHEAGHAQVPEHVSRMQSEVQQAGQFGNSSTGAPGLRNFDGAAGGDSKAASHLPKLDLVGHSDSAPGGGGCSAREANGPRQLGRPGAPSPSGGFGEMPGAAGGSSAHSEGRSGLRNGSEAISGHGRAAGSSAAYKAEIPVTNYRHN